MTDDFDTLMRIRLGRWQVPSGTGERAIRAAAFIAQSTPEDIKGPCRKAYLARPRQAAMYALRSRGWTLPRIAKLFERDHTTALYACRTVEKDKRRLAMAHDIEGLLG